MNWDRRRRNIRVLMAERNIGSTKLAMSCGLSPNTLSNFLRGVTKTLSSTSLDLILPKLGLTSVQELDTDNPLADPLIDVMKIIKNLDHYNQLKLLEELRSRWPNASQDR